MKRTVTLTLALTFAIAVAVAATASGQYGKSPDQMMQASSKTVKLTGCLESGAEPGTFKLTGVTGDMTGMSGKGTEAEGTSGKDEMSDMKKTVDLLGSKKLDSEMKNHVGHKVEVTGSWDMSKSSSESSAAGTSGQSTMGSMSNMRLKVASFRHVSETCTPE